MELVASLKPKMRLSILQGVQKLVCISELKSPGLGLSNLVLLDLILLHLVSLKFVDIESSVLSNWSSRTRTPRTQF